MKLFALFFVLISPLFSLEHELTFSECQKQLTQVCFAEAAQNTTPSSILLLGNIDPTLPSFLQQQFPSCQISTTIQSEPVDCVILLNLLEKDPHPEQIVWQMHQALKPSGIGVVVVAPLGLMLLTRPFFSIPYRHVHEYKQLFLQEGMRVLRVKQMEARVSADAEQFRKEMELWLGTEMSPALVRYLDAVNEVSSSFYTVCFIVQK